MKKAWLSMLMVMAYSIPAMATRHPLVPLEPAARTYGANVVVVTFGDDFNVEAGIDPESYLLAGPGFQGKAVAKVGRHSQIRQYIHRGWPYQPVMKHTVFLMLSKPLEAGGMYALRVRPEVTGKVMTLQFSFADTNLAADLIKINQCGYLPGERKVAYLGGWLGDLGALNLQAIPGSFALMDLATDEPVFQGESQLSKKNDSESGETVYWIDFTAFDTPGRYAIEVAGVGRSYPFVIGREALVAPMVITARGLYHQRCGTALTEPFTGWTRGECHKRPAKLVTFYHSMDSVMKDLPHSVDPSGTLIDGWGGWHDAGDFDRLGHRHLETINDLLEAFETNPHVFADNQLNIPGAGNGIPDILDEAKWGLDWFERMFDPEDGGFYYRIETERYGQCLPEKDDQPLYAMTKYPFYSTWSGVPFAKAARIFRPYDAKLAEHYLGIARKALEYGQNALKTERRDLERLANAVGWLAAEIYITTGEAEAHRIFLNSKTRVSYSYALCNRPDVNIAARQAARQHFIEAAERVLSRLRTEGYVSTIPGTSGGDAVVFDAAALLRGYQISRRPEFRRASLINLDHYLGANPLGYVWITGVGSKYPMRILHHPSENDGRDEPAPGIPIFGPRRVTAESGATHARLFGERLYPDAEDFPFLRCYGELPAIVGFSEFTTKSQSNIVFVCSFFAAPAASE